MGFFDFLDSAQEALDSIGGLVDQGAKIHNGFQDLVGGGNVSIQPPWIFAPPPPTTPPVALPDLSANPGPYGHGGGGSGSSTHWGPLGLLVVVGVLLLVAR